MALRLFAVALAAAVAVLAGAAAAYKQSLSDFDADIQALVAGMTLEAKVGQMTQLDIRLFGQAQGTEFVLNEQVLNATFDQYMIGSILNTPVDPAVGTLSQLNVTQLSAMHTRLQQIALDRGSRIPIVYGLDSVHGANYVRGAAIFPQSLNAAASFNRALVQRQGAITAKDTRATGIPWAFSPILGIAVQPSWPRVYETFGEDPFLASAMATAIITGLQGGGGATGASNPLQRNLSSPYAVAACMKHFVGYSNPRTGHDRTPAWISDRYLHQYFVPSFRAAVKAGVSTAMESYHAVNGVPMVSSHQYLVALLRDELQFDGMLVTDYAEIEQLHLTHRVASSPLEAVRIALQNTSIDMSMVATDNSFPGLVEQLVTADALDTARIDVSAARVLQLKKDLGLLSNPFGPAWDSPQVASVGSDADREVARQLARESVVMVQNTGGFLPLDTLTSANPHHKRLLFAGPSCDSLRRQSGGWTLHWQGAEEWEFPFGSTIVGAARQLVAAVPGVSVEHRWGGVDINGTLVNATAYADAVATARASDVVVACIGEDAYAEKPGDINDLTLPWNLLRFVEDLTTTGTPVVVVLLQGRPRIVQDKTDSARSVLYAMLPGPDGGLPIAEILFGRTNPSGRLPISYPQFPAATLAPYWRTYSQEPIFPKWAFGHGRSFSTFTYSPLTLSATTIADPTVPLTVTVTVTNAGPLPGQETVLLFVGDDYRIVAPEIALLKGFDKTAVLAVGASQTVSFQLLADDLAFYGLQNERRTEDGTFTITVASSVGPQDQQTTRTAAFTLAVGNFLPPPPAPACDGDSCLIRSPGPLIGSVVGAFAVGAISVLIFVRCMRSGSGSTGGGDAYANMSGPRA